MEVALLFSMVIGLMLIGVPIAISLGMSSVPFSVGLFRQLTGISGTNPIQRV